MADEAPDDGRVSDLVYAGADLAGALSGGAVGLVGGPAGALGGAAVGVFVARGARAIVGRFHDRERDRAGAALVLIAANARDREARGEKPRDDGFFNGNGGLRPDGVEILEGVLLQAANAFEERKVPLLANLYAAVAHDATIAAADAHYLVREAGALTYRQFVALAVYADWAEHFGYPGVGARFDHPPARKLGSAQAGEIDDLADRGLLGVPLGDQVEVVHASIDSSVVLSQLGRGAAGIALTEAGALIARLTAAADIDRAEQDAWVTELASGYGRARPSSRDEEAV